MRTHAEGDEEEEGDEDVEEDVEAIGGQKTGIEKKKRRRGQLVPVDAAAQNQADHEQQIVVSICMHGYIVTCRESDRYMV